MELKGSKTEQNLWAAFAGESQARNKYTYYASKAKKMVMFRLLKFLKKQLQMKKKHAKIWFKLVDKIGTTEENLKAAAAGEHEEWTSMYPEFAKVAREEGFTRIANLFEMVAKIEQEHDARYNLLLANIQEDKVFKRNEKMIWMCSNCGHVYEGTEAPEICPVCAHPKAFFEIKANNY